MTKDPTATPQRPLWAKTLRWGLFAIMACVLLLTLAWTGLQTRWAKDRLGAWIASLTAGNPGYQVAIEGLDGLLPFSILLDRLTLSDAKGAWLEGRCINLSISPGPLIIGMLDVPRFRMEGLSISRFPESGQAQPDQSRTHPGSAPLSLPHVMVREMEIHRIDIGAAAAGAPLSYRLDSNAQTDGPQLEIRALFQDLHRPEDVLRLTAAYDLKTEQVDAEATYHESKGGLAAGLMGLSKATGTRFQVKAKGPLAAVKGRLELDVGGYGTVGFDLEAGLKEPLSLTLGGQVRADPSIVPADVAARLGGLEIGLKCRADMTSNPKIHIRTFTASAPSGTVSVEGSADLAAGLMDLQATALPLNVSPFLKDSGISLEGLGPVHLAAKGAFSQPEVTIAAALKALKVQGTTFKDITIEARGAVGVGYRGLQKAEASVSVQGMEVPQVPDLKGPLRGDVTAASPDFIRWDVGTLRLAGPEITVSSEGAQIDMDSGLISGDLLVAIQRMAAFMPAGPANVDGRLVVRARVEGNAATRQIRADLNMELTDLSGLPPQAAAAAGPKLALKARAAVEDGILTLEDARLSATHSELEAEGRLDLKQGTWDGQYRLSFEDLSPIGKALHMDLSGPAESHGRFSGAGDNVAADIVLSSEGLRVNDLDLKAIQARLAAKGLPDRPSGSLHMKGAAMDQTFQLDTEVAWSGDRLTVSGLKAALPGIDLAADIAVAAGEPRVAGTAGGTIRSLKVLSALFGLDMEGSGQFRLKSGEPGAREAMTLNADFKDLRCNPYSVPALHIAGRVDDLTRLHGRVRIEAADAVVRDFRLAELRADLTGSLDKATVNVEARGSVLGKGAHDGLSNVPVSLSAGLRMAHQDGWQFRMDRFKVLCGEEEIVLAHPATATLRHQELDLDDLQLDAAKGRLQVKGNLNQDRVQASAAVTDLPLALLAPLLGRPSTGTVSAACDISGPLADPALHAALHIHDYPIPREKGMAPILLDASLNADRRGNRIEAELTLSGLDPTPFTATASLPARLSLRPFAFDPDKNADLNGRLQGRFDLSALQGLPGMGDQTISGDIEADMGVTGSVENWALKGGVAIHNGRYENTVSGTILANINGRIEADGRDLRLTRLTATDGEAGTIALEGGIAAVAPFPLDADLTFQRATLLRKESATSTASGRLDLRGTPKRLDLTGKIILDRTELEIPKRLPPDVVVIPVKEINLPPGMSAQETESPHGSRHLFMDLSLNIPARFFVRGRGLDAEFKGDLTAQGPVNNPVIRGTLSVVRGTFQFMTRTFHITQGEIAFDGATPPVPLLNITTQVSAGQIEAQVQVTGPADDFKLKLTSQPHLPQDEIMANILFGQSVAKLNAFQAYQLAASISQLSGGGIPDIVGKTRSLLGVDRLSISGGDTTQKSDRGPTVSAGKYVSEDVYVGVEQELTDAKQDVVVEVDVTPHFSVESRAGTRSGAGIGFNWKYDY